jgi:hypothetical protein
MCATHRRAWVRWCLGGLVLVLASCGGGGGGGGESTHPPTISNLQFPESVYQFDGNGTTTIGGSFDYSDAGGDLATFTITSPGAGALTADIQGAAGSSTGTIIGQVEIDTTTAGTFDFQIYVTDAGGLRSNMLTGAIQVKPNDTATSWQPASTLPGASVWQRRVRWSGTQLVTVGDAIFTSPDGLVWTQQAPPAAPLNDVVWTGSLWVAVGDQSIVLTSPDGVAWTSRAVPLPAGAALQGVAGTAQRLIAVGSEPAPFPGSQTAVILTSIDGGATWAQVAQGAYAAALDAVAWSGTRFVTVGTALGQINAQPIVLTSTDGLVWTSQILNLGALSSLFDIAWGGSRFVAVGYSGGATSIDGVTWQQTGAGVLAANHAIAWSGSRFLSCGTVYCQVSTDGIQWVTTQLPGVGPNTYGVVWNGTRWVVVGTNSYLAISP